MEFNRFSYLAFFMIFVKTFLKEFCMSRNKHARRTPGFSSIALALVACLALVSQSFGVAAKYGQLSIKNSHFVNASGYNVQLKGMSMYAWTSAAIGFYNATAIGHLAQDWKCTAIRIPYMPGGSVSMAKLDAVLQACVDNGIYGIVDWHGNSGASQVATFYTTVATKWHGYPNIMYEPWNEPTVAWSTIKPYMETVIKAIRAVDPTNIIICGNPQWDQKPQDAAANPITDATNIAYSMHFYAASHSVAGFGPGITTAMSKGCAIFITEYGTCNASGGSPINLTATQAWYDFLDKNAIGSTNWGVEYEDQGGAACFNRGVSNTGPWTNANMTSEGLFVKAYIAKGAVVDVTNDFKPQQRASVAAWNDLLTGVAKSAAVYNINGARCAAGSKLPNGLYIVRIPGTGNARVLNVVR
jgi:endoglucanase